MAATDLPRCKSATRRCSAATSFADLQAIDAGCLGNVTVDFNAEAD